MRPSAASTIERAAKKVNITIQTARPGIVIGKKGEDIEKLRQETANLLGMAVNDVRLNIAEIRKPELDSKLVADSIAQQIEKRVMFRRAMKRAVMSTMRSRRAGREGARVRPSERSEIARTEWYREGRVPLHTFRADIDYGLSEAAPLTASSASRCGSSRAKCSTSPSSTRPSRAEGARPLRARWSAARRRRPLAATPRACE